MDIQDNPIIKELCQDTQRSGCKLPKGSGSKPALSMPPDDCLTLSVAELSGVTSYDPEEFTISAYAGTPVKEIQNALNAHGQYLPFDPPFTSKGATIGGATASGLNGPGRYRFGGMRDFLLAIQFIDGFGNLVKAGGKVVKNAAGFDLPKLMIGSLGRLGILVELTFKVFPRPESFASIRSEFKNLSDALHVLEKFHNAQLDVDSLDLDVCASGIVLISRIGGLYSSFQARQERLVSFIGTGDTIPSSEEGDLWESRRNFENIPEDWKLIKVPLTPTRIPAFESKLSENHELASSVRMYSSGGQQVWISFPDDERNQLTFNSILISQNLSGLVIKGFCQNPRMGVDYGKQFANRIKQALDPYKHFPEI
jgi:glycolate oxidase FAD binding subunit